MPISAYVGSLGSGKSYEVVASVIVPACLSGRRVVTNIYGINKANIHEHCKKISKKKDIVLGDVIYVENKQVSEENFFPYKDSLPSDTFCQYGDLIVVDESWRIWESDKSICEKHRSFIAEHRHFTNEETGVCCDLVVINQEVSSLPRFIKARLDTTFRMQKHIALGMKNRYRVDVFNGAKLFKANKVTSYQRKYEPAIFPLYKSYEGGSGKELTVDGRASIFGKKSVFILAALMAVVFIICMFFLYSFFTRKNEDKKEHQYVQKTELTQFTSQPASAVPATEKPKLSTTWRISGKLSREGRKFVVITNNAGLIRIVPASTFSYHGMQMVGIVDDELVTFYSGAEK
ncbi:zonular occludens toxin family protein [Enterobacter hormaechei]